MKIGIDASDISIQTDKGGVYRYITNLLTNLKAVDHENQYILFFNYFRNRHQRPCREAMDLLEGASMKTVLTRIPRIWEQLHIPVNVFIGRVDIFHGPFDYMLPVVGCKKIVTVHDLRYFDIYPRIRQVLPELDGFHSGSESFSRWNLFMTGMQKRVQASVRKADHLITVSAFTKNVLIRILGVQPHRVHVVHNGVQPCFRPVPDEESVRQLLRRHDIHGPYFLYVGQLDPFKNILRLLEAFHILKNSDPGFQHQLVCVTPSSKSHWFFPLILRKMEELALDKEILFLRNIPDEELPLFYNGASALLIPSLYEGFGMPALEAMACGTPVVASRACSLPEVVDDAAVLVDPFLPASIADGMEKVLKDRQLRESLMERGLRRAARFSWEKTAADTVNVYKKVRSS